jgi:hypothetical protein
MLLVILWRAVNLADVKTEVDRHLSTADIHVCYCTMDEPWLNGASAIEDIVQSAVGVTINDGVFI